MTSSIIVIGIGLIVVGLALPLSNMFATRTKISDNSLGLRGNVDMTLYDELGNIKTERHIDNLIVDIGIEGVAYRIAPHDGSITPSAPYNYIAIGTGNTAVDAEDDTLSAELSGISYSRKQDSTAQYIEASGNKLILSVVFGPGEGTGSLRESGIFNASTGGDMLARQTFDEIQKASGDTLTITWTITLSPT
jgi:hypothetical protein